MREKIIAGNWKMNCNLEQTLNLLKDIEQNLNNRKEAVSIIVAPTYPNLYPAHQVLKETPISLAAQNMHQSENGAFTGEVSASMLKSVGVNFVILGHSERRKYFSEDNALLAEKVDTALAHDFHVIFCIGENLTDRENDNHFEVVKKQLNESLFHLNKNSWKNIVLAYEPVWAIGTGKTASPEQAQEMHAFIRQTLTENYPKELAKNVSILYGGSVKPHNAQKIFSQTDVDGGLIGGASLKTDDFMDIVNAF